TAYQYAWRMTIPDPSAVTFDNHSYYAPTWSESACVATTVVGIHGQTGTWTRYTKKHALGTSWTDTYPTGYGASESTTCLNPYDYGPFVTSAHCGSHNYASG